jgi:hypothetical protein
MQQVQIRLHRHEKTNALCVMSRKSEPEITMLQNPSYRQTIRACDNLMKNPKLSLYEEVERLNESASRRQGGHGPETRSAVVLDVAQHVYATSLSVLQPDWPSGTRPQTTAVLGTREAEQSNSQQDQLGAI